MNKDEKSFSEAVKSLDKGTIIRILQTNGITAGLEPLDPSDVGTIVKSYTEIQFQKNCWNKISSIEHGCEVWEATCDKSQIDIHKPNTIFVQSHQYEKTGHVIVCPNKIELPETKRIV